MSAMLTLEEAQARLLELARPTEVLMQPADELKGPRCLARDIQALRIQPAADLSAMDGYAIAGSGPWRRMGESRAGAPFAGTLSEGQCARISTGAHMPEGSDRVLIQENAKIDGDIVAATELPAQGQHVRRRGFDFGEGDNLLSAGTKVGPAQIALAMSAGHAELPVWSAPRVSVLDSGDELVRDPSRCGPGQIPASNGAMIAAMLQPYAGEVERVGPVPDERAAMVAALDTAERADIIVTSGGASVGDHDHLQDALRDWGADLAFWKVAIKPGKPLLVATRKRAGNPDQIIVGLPGNPVSSFVTCFLFALPLVRANLGDPSPLPKTRPA
ncbi:MAG: molybdopterin molybdotransferase MoeA, partial [Pseudomonadota bacterium]